MKITKKMVEISKIVGEKTIKSLHEECERLKLNPKQRLDVEIFFLESIIFSFIDSHSVTPENALKLFCQLLLKDYEDNKNKETRH